MINKKEFLKTLEIPFELWRKSDKSKISELTDSNISEMIGFNQKNPHHCYTLMEHSLHTTEYICSSESMIKTSAELLETAAFFHDIGKPTVAREKEGRLVFYNHAEKSSEISNKILSDMGYSDEEKKLILFFIRHHDDFISYVLPSEKYDKSNPFLKEITEKNISEHIHKNSISSNEYSTEDIWSDLLLLCSADINAQADVVYMNGKITDSKEHKLSKINAVRNALYKIV